MPKSTAASSSRSLRSARSRSRPRFIARQSGIHGRGVFALAAIAKGGRIVEYIGERISHREAERRERAAQGHPAHTFLFILDDKVVIDATRGGNSARWINHSCSPNCESDDEDGRMFIKALRNIRPGEELTYDYNLVLVERHTPAAKREHQCLCSSRQCRATLLGPKR